MSCPITGAATTFEHGDVDAGANPISVDNKTAFSGWGEEVEDIERNLIDDPAGAPQRYCPGDRVAHDDLEISTEIDLAGLGGDPPGGTPAGAGTHPLRAERFGILTFQTGSGEQTPGRLEGTGYWKRRGFDSIETNQIVPGVYVWKFNGRIGPTWVKPTYSP